MGRQWNILMRHGETVEHFDETWGDIEYQHDPGSIPLGDGSGSGQCTPRYRTAEFPTQIRGKHHTRPGRSRKLGRVSRERWGTMGSLRLTTGQPARVTDDLVRGFHFYLCLYGRLTTGQPARVTDDPVHGFHFYLCLYGRLTTGQPARVTDDPVHGFHFYLCLYGVCSRKIQFLLEVDHWSSSGPALTSIYELVFAHGTIHGVVMRVSPYQLYHAHTHASPRLLAQI
ncbi:hypothetical protein RRG08_033424 [Elysia crispata]|uniref:Uncharacterized protein n=1 Tax=Elysia crispata TaxID=231223 RepID=A0AAE1E4L8_9GAST|nr:hypothetical protein RRG08_033424 [Elysia crispata]